MPQVWPLKAKTNTHTQRKQNKTKKPPPARIFSQQNISGNHISHSDILFFQSLSFQNYINCPRGRWLYEAQGQSRSPPHSLCPPDGFLLMQEGLSSVSSHKRFFIRPRRPCCHLQEHFSASLVSYNSFREDVPDNELPPFHPLK